MKNCLLVILFLSFQIKAERLLGKINPTFNSADLNLLATSQYEQMFSLSGLSEEMQFKRINLYYPDSKIIVDDGFTKKTISNSGRLYFISYNTPEKTTLSFDPSDRTVRGYIHHQQLKYHFVTTISKPHRIKIHETAKHDAFACLNDILQLADPNFPDITQINLPSSTPKNRGVNPTYQAHIAVDTDNEIMWKKFSNNPATATAWIESLFLNMNVIYESELDLRLLIATIILRIDNTPLNAPDYNTDPDGFNDSLFTFRTYWNANFAHIDRVFAMLISGNGIGPGSFSGIAFVNAYCGSSSYSYNLVGANLSSSFTSLFIGHEVGHNLGSGHTHCEQLANGGADFVDQCYANVSGCYSGTPACVAGGVGTIMSYCHSPPGGFDGGGPETGPPNSPSCNTSKDMHPLIVDKLDGQIQNRYPNCIKDFGTPFDVIFANDFE